MYDHINADTNNQRKVLHVLILCGYAITAAFLRDEIRERLGKAPSVSTIRRQLHELRWQGVAKPGSQPHTWVPDVETIVGSARNDGIRLTPAETRALYRRDMAATKDLLALTLSAPQRVEADGVPLAFGHKSAAPNDGRPVWGARLNIKAWGLDFPHTNQDTHKGDASPAELRAFKASINAGALDTIKRDAHDLIQTGQLREDEVAEVATGDRYLRCLARRAGGYVHLCAFRLDRELPEGLEWSGAEPPPAIGTVVRPTITDPETGEPAFGAGPVLGYYEEHGWLAVRYLPSSGPDWYLRQNGGLTPAVVFGIDLAPTPSVDAGEEACRDCA